MPRAPSEKMKQAEQLYQDGMKQVDIAKKLGVPEGTIRRWKHDYRWDTDGKISQCERSEKDSPEKRTFGKKQLEKANVRKRGAQPGNKNSVGHSPSVPKRNKNAEKHGAYARFYWDTMDEYEKSLMIDVPPVEEYNLQQQIAIYTIRERRLMHHIQEFKKNASKGLYVKGMKKKKHALYNEDGKPVNEYEDTITDTENAMKGIIALESELTKIQRAKTKCIDSLIRLRAINERYDDLLNGWKAKAAAESKENDNEEIEEVQIYIPYNGRDEI